jgi:hypothetical protein
MKEIITILEPTISPTRIELADYDEGITGNKIGEYFGHDSPLIQIGNLFFYDSMIKFMELDFNSFMPNLNLSVNNVDGRLTSYDYPKDGDIIKLFIKSRNSAYKPIALDFRVMNISAPPTDNDRGFDMAISITAVLDIPHIYKQHYKSFAGLNTLDTLLDIARDLGVGLATNETAYNDVMTRVCPFQNYLTFIQDVTLSAYKSDNSFFTCFIDGYYYLNLIECNDLFTNDYDIPDVDYIESAAIDYRANNKPERRLSKFFLSNSKAVTGTPFYVAGYSVINNTGSISMANGYRRYLRYYDKDRRDTEEYFIETLNTPKSENLTILKGRDDEDHREQLTFSDYNYQYNANVHANYYHAIEQNFFNLSEINKMGLVVDLGEINPIITRAKIVPVVMVIKGDSTTDDNEQIDRFISGNYVVNGYKIVYDAMSRKYNMRLFLVKREWNQNVL